MKTNSNSYTIVYAAVLVVIVAFLGKFRRLHDAAKRIRGPSVVTGWLNECIRGRTNNRSHLQSDYQLTNSCPIC